MAGEIGYPVVLKAAGGGGGRGIRIVREEGKLASEFQTAAREASGAFDDERLYVERFGTPARHVEVQVLGDGESTIHLHERDCSLQRRRQKMVEESPAPSLAEETRAGLFQAAVSLCSAIGYRSAGTVEFLVDAESGEFFFIEMNTRIQVEHPVTELVTGIDLIAEQLRIAGGEPVSLAQHEVVTRGSAMELRINAEDPSRGFAPSPGELRRVVLPAGPWVESTPGWNPGGWCRRSMTRCSARSSCGARTAPRRWHAHVARWMRWRWRASRPTARFSLPCSIRSGSPGRSSTREP